MIRDCRMSGGHGALVIGSAVSGGVENVEATDCVIKNTMQGIRIKTMRGRGGYVKNVSFRNIEIENVYGNGAQTAIEIKGLPEKPLKNVTLKNINLTADKAMAILDTEGISLDNVVVSERRQHVKIV